MSLLARPRVRLLPFASALVSATHRSLGQVAAPTLTPAAAAQSAPAKPWRLYGWIQQGFTANVDAPDDRVNFGVTDLPFERLRRLVLSTMESRRSPVWRPRSLRKKGVRECCSPE